MDHIFGGFGRGGRERQQLCGRRGGREEADMGWWGGGLVGDGRLGGGHRSPREPAIRVGSVSKIYRK